MDEATSPEPWIDPDDAPPLTAEWFAGADVYDNVNLLRRGQSDASLRLIVPM